MTLQAVLTQAEHLINTGDHKKALALCLKAYAHGHKSYELVRLSLDCLNSMGNVQDQLELISKVLMEAQFEPKDQARLYFRQGLIYTYQKKDNMARDAFWNVHKLEPDFPGLQARLSQFSSQKPKAGGRYAYLLESEFITQEELDNLLEKAGEQNLESDVLLLSEFDIPKEELGKSLELFYNTDFVAFDSGIEPPFELFEKRRLDPEFLKKYKWVPYRQEGKTIEVLMANPFDLGRLDEIKFIFGSGDIEAKVALGQDIEQFIENFYRQLSSGDELSAFDEEVDIDEADSSGDEDGELSEQDSEVVRMVNALLVEAWRKGVSDIHIEPNPRRRYCMFRFRIDGTCHEFRKVRQGLARPLVSRIKIMAHLDIAERRLPQDGKIKIKIPDRDKVVEYRIATIPTVENQEDVVMRVLASGKPLPLEKLGLSPFNMPRFQEMLFKPYGLVLVVGPTGSGKTTTLHSGLSYINTPERKIWTAEDPVEITQDGLRQVQVSPKIGLDFASALRSFLRADPDVIMIGEMRDKETAHIGVEASLTGHLVFSTLHTNSAPETITRLLDMDLDPFNFADSLLCVLAQRLMKTLCPACKESYSPDKKELEELALEFGDGWDKCSASFLEDENLKLYRPKGCAQCMNSGYKGRVGVHELMVTSPGLKDMIKHRKQTEEIRKQAVQDGMLSLKQDGILKVLEGRTDMDQVRKVTGG